MAADRTCCWVFLTQQAVVRSQTSGDPSLQRHYSKHTQRKSNLAHARSLRAPSRDASAAEGKGRLSSDLLRFRPRRITRTASHLTARAS